MNDLKPRADLSAVSSLLRRYAHFEGEVTPPPTTPPDKTATPAGTNGGSEGDKKVFTQEDVEFHAKERAKTAAQSERKKVLAELGIEDPDADKALLAEARKRKADEQTEVEKTAAELTKEKAKREAAESELKSFQEKVETEKRAAALDGAITKALTTANAKAEKVLKLLKVDQAEALTAVLKEDGTVDEAKLKALVETARKLYPEDFKVPMGTFSLKDGRPLKPDPANQGTGKHYNRL